MPTLIPPPRLAELMARLAATDSATRLLAEWCAAHGIGAGAVQARRLAPPDPPAAPCAALLAALAAPPAGVLRHRLVQLLRGGEILSDCQVWWPEGALSPAMEAALAGTATPFGLVIAPLSPRRRTLEVTPLAPPGAHVLRVQALVLAADGPGPPRPLAVVDELYRRVLVGPEADRPRLPATAPA